MVTGTPCSCQPYSATVANGPHGLNTLQNRGSGSDNPMPDKVPLQNGDVLLVMVRDGTVFHYSQNMSLPHVEFVRRKTGGGPEGAGVGTVSKLNDEIVGITSKYFYDYQLPAPPEVDRVLQDFFGPSPKPDKALQRTAGLRPSFLARLFSRCR